MLQSESSRHRVSVSVRKKDIDGAPTSNIEHGKVDLAIPNGTEGVPAPDAPGC